MKLNPDDPEEKPPKWKISERHKDGSVTYVRVKKSGKKVYKRTRRPLKRSKPVSSSVMLGTSGSNRPKKEKPTDEEVKIMESVDKKLRDEGKLLTPKERRRENRDTKREKRINQRWVRREEKEKKKKKERTRRDRNPSNRPILGIFKSSGKLKNKKNRYKSRKGCEGDNKKPSSTHSGQGGSCPT